MYEVELDNDKTSFHLLGTDHLGRDILFRSLGAEFRVVRMCIAASLLYLFFFYLMTTIKKNDFNDDMIQNILLSINTYIPLLPICLFVMAVLNSEYLLPVILCLIFISFRPCCRISGHFSDIKEFFIREIAVLNMFVIMIHTDIEFILHTGPVPSFGKVLSGVHKADISYQLILPALALILINLICLLFIYRNGENVNE
jgi:hypothetical protein